MNKKDTTGSAQAVLFSLRLSFSCLKKIKKGKRKRPNLTLLLNKRRRHYYPINSSPVGLTPTCTLKITPRELVKRPHPQRSWFKWVRVKNWYFKTFLSVSLLRQLILRDGGERKVVMVFAYHHKNIQICLSFWKVIQLCYIFYEYHSKSYTGLRLVKHIY